MQRYFVVQINVGVTRDPVYVVKAKKYPQIRGNRTQKCDGFYWGFALYFGGSLAIGAEYFCESATPWPELMRTHNYVY